MWNVSAPSEPVQMSAAAVSGQCATLVSPSASAPAASPAAAKPAAPAMAREARVTKRSQGEPAARFKAALRQERQQRLELRLVCGALLGRHRVADDPLAGVEVGDPLAQQRASKRHAELAVLGQVRPP